MADVYEALTSERPYRAALSSDAALAIIGDDVPARFDADAFALLQRLLEGDAAEPPGRRAAALSRLDGR